VKSCLKLDWKPPDTRWQVMDSTTHGPSFWKTSDTMVTSSFCIGQLEELKSRLHGQQRQKLQENISKTVRIREKENYTSTINVSSGNSLLSTHSHPLPLQLEKYLRSHLTYILLIQSTIGMHSQDPCCRIELGNWWYARGIPCGNTSP